VTSKVEDSLKANEPITVTEGSVGWKKSERKANRGSHRGGSVRERSRYDVRLIFATSLSIAGQRLADVNTGPLVADISSKGLTVQICWACSGVSSY
jgi:hypothetical protein